jgi:MYXO-CTERM domain-containing protein
MRRTLLLSSALCSLLTCLAGLASAATEEPHSAHQFPSNPPAGTVRASVEVRIEPITAVGLKFFALQANFTNGVAAHGGPQRVDGVLKANWGALTSNSNYAFDATTPVAARLDALEKMQNAGVRTDAVAWEPDVLYRLEVVRGNPVTLPVGDYSVLDEPAVHVDHARPMTEWTFTMRRVDTQAVVFTKTLDVASDAIAGWSYWTETGYGVTCDEKLRIHWQNPETRDGSGATARPAKIQKSIAQSTCPLAKTTDIQPELFDLLGTVQTYGEPRASDSRDGQTLDPRAPGAATPDAGQADAAVTEEPDAGPTNATDAAPSSGCRSGGASTRTTPLEAFAVAGLVLVCGLRRRRAPRP